MKKILFVATVDSHILHFHIPYLKLFKENGYEVHVATNGNEKIPYCDKKYTIPIERSPYKLRNIKAIKQLKEIIDNEKYDIIHCHTPMGSVVTRLAARKARKKHHTRVIYTAHGFHFYKGAPLLNWMLFYPVEKYLAKYTDTLITINNEDYELAKKKFNRRCKDIQYVPGVGIDTKKFDIEMTENEKNELRKSLGLKKNDFVMICIGELNDNKNQIFQINAMRLLSQKYKNIKLLLVGNGVKRDFLENKIEEYNLQNYVYLLGYRNDIPNLLKISNLVLSTSKREGLPVNILEAMYIGLPIVASDCRGNRDLVKDGVNGYLIKLNDNKKFKNRIEKIYKSEEIALKFSEENKKIINDYLLDKIMFQMHSIYFKKKKVLYVLSSNSYSGAEKVICTIINNINNKYDCTYCSPNGSIHEILKEEKIDYYPINKMSYFEVKKAIKKLRPDIIHANDFKASFICALLKNKKNYLIEHIHNNTPWLKKICIKSLIFLYSSVKSDKILTVSDSIKNEYIFSRYIQKKIICIKNPIGVSEVLNNVSAKDYLKKYDICCVARITSEKNPIKFLNIISLIKQKLPYIKTIWIGDGELREEVERKIKELNLNNSVNLIGFKKNPYKYLAQSKTFLLTSDWEGFGLAAFEALALGVPAVVSNVGGLPLIVDESCGKLCSNNEEYADIIIELLSSTSKLKKYSLNAKKKAALISNVSEYINELIDIYENK